MLFMVMCSGFSGMRAMAAAAPATGGNSASVYVFSSKEKAVHLFVPLSQADTVVTLPFTNLSCDLLNNL